MATCNGDCIHCEVCINKNKLVKINTYVWDEYQALDEVDRFCEHFKQISKYKIDEVIETIISSSHKDTAYIIRKQKEKLEKLQEKLKEKESKQYE